MKKILESLNNPFDKEGFIKLLNMFLNSESFCNFYGKIVLYNIDRPTGGEISYLKVEPYDYLNASYFDDYWRHFEYFSDFFPTEHRIYVNSSLKSMEFIVKNFTEKCIDLNIPFELKYGTEEVNRSDGIVIGSNSMVYKKHIEILRELAEKNPEILSQCGTPHLLSGNLDGWIGLADEYTPNRMLSYTQSRIYLIYSACIKYLLNHPEYQTEIEGSERMYNHFDSIMYDLKNNLPIEKTENFTTLQKEQYINQRFDEWVYSYRSSIYKINFQDFAKIINKNYPESINEMYQIFLECCTIRGIDSNMPIMNINSKHDLLQVEEKEQTIEESDLENKNYIDLIQMLSINLEDTMSIQDSIIILKALEKNMSNEIKILGESLLNTFSLVDMDNKEFGDKLVSLCRGYIEDINSLFQKKEGIYRKKLKFETNEELDSIKEKYFTYFSNSLQPIEKMEKSLSIIQSMDEKYTTYNKYK